MKTWISMASAVLGLATWAASAPCQAQDQDPLTYLRETPVNLLTWGIRQNEEAFERSANRSLAYAEIEYSVGATVLFIEELGLFVVHAFVSQGIEVPFLPDADRRYVCRRTMQGLFAGSALNLDGETVFGSHSAFSERFLNFGGGNLEFSHRLQSWIDDHTVLYVYFPSISTDGGTANFGCFLHLGQPLEQLTYEDFAEPNSDWSRFAQD